VRNKRTTQFRKLYNRLPLHVQYEAQDTYKLFLANPYHPSLHFKQIDSEDPVYSVRIGRKYRAVGWYSNGTILWYWIGTHEEYNKL
jgi:hypothetical protein